VTKYAPLSLGSLVSSGQFQGALDLRPIEGSGCRLALAAMMRIRAAENRLALARRDGLIGGPVHLGVGQEAIAVGVSMSLRSTDRVFGAHRSHSHLLALGSSVYRLFAEVLGKDTGHSRGMGGSMHLWDQPRGFYGSVPIVAGTVALAVGAGLAAKFQRSGDVAVAYLGDGAVEEGVVHESLNLARIQNVPVVFVIENNLFASHMHISIRQPSDATARFAEANRIPFEIVDGNDVVTMERVGREAVQRARSGGGPSFIEAVTYRWYGHVDWREDIDVGVNRSEADVASWKARDPIARLRTAMVSAGMWFADDDANLEYRVNEEIDEAWKQAMLDPYPSEEALLSRVYAAKGIKS
jgi:TPP-dependent pyruvate/acetoin dehydrogenase alpha subunit